MIQSVVPELEFRNGVWVYKHDVRYSAVPVIETTQKDNVLVSYVSLVKGYDVVFLYGNRSDLQNNAIVCIELSDSKHLTLENPFHLIPIHRLVSNRIKATETNFDQLRSKRLHDELDQIGELERKLRVELGNYRTK